MIFYSISATYYKQPLTAGTNEVCSIYEAKNLFINAVRSVLLGEVEQEDRDAAGCPWL